VGFTIAVDAMGGDLAPEAIVLGTLQAVETGDLSAILVGDEARIRAFLPDGAPDRVTIVHTDEEIGMGESPTTALRQKPKASLTVAVQEHQAGRADAVVSAGNTGAFYAASLLTLGRLPGVSRPTIGTFIPTQNRTGFLLDVGTNPDCKPVHLQQFGIMGSIFVEHMIGQENPTVGLLSIGEESSKGNEVTIEAHKLLRETAVNFIGNVEGRDVLAGTVDLIVCDGFVGNVLLKYTESLYGLFKSKLQEAAGAMSEEARAALQPVTTGLKQQFDYQQYGGVPMLGLDGVAIVCHGGSSPEAMKNAIFAAQRVVDTRVNDLIRERIVK
jgi:phosphate acyltransferase